MRRAQAGIFVTLTAVYLLAGGREGPWGDAQIMYEVAESMVARRNVEAVTDWSTATHQGADGRLYAQYPVATSLQHVPAVILRGQALRFAPQLDRLVYPLASHLAPALLAALCCAIFFGMARRLGASAVSASVVTATLGLGTMVFVYARSPYSESLQVLAFTGFAATLLRLWDEPARKDALLLGLWGGLLLNSKPVFAASLALGAAVLVVRLWSNRKALAVVAGWGAIGVAPLVAVALTYNHLRWGSPFETGYREPLSLLRESTWAGLLGLVLSPGKSIFLYSPAVALAVLAIPRFVRRHRGPALVLLLIILPPVLVHARSLSWNGDWCWGPRYLVFAVPCLLLPLAGWLDSVRQARRWTLAAAFGLVAALGLFVQLLGSAFYWDHWIRLSTAAREAWLGKPDRSGAAIAEAGRGHCDSCFEDMHGHNWLPPLQPIAGHLWLLRHVPAGDAWSVAEADAPWRRYTSLSLPLESVYRRARVDWWGLILVEQRPVRVVGLALFVVLAAAAGLGVRSWMGGARGGSPGGHDAGGP